MKDAVLQDGLSMPRKYVWEAQEEEEAQIIASCLNPDGAAGSRSDDGNPKR